MSTFGPVYTPYEYTRDEEGQRLYGPFITESGESIGSIRSGYFWDMDSDDDLKPVVHCKPCTVSGTPYAIFTDGAYYFPTAVDVEAGQLGDGALHYSISWRTTGRSAVMARASVVDNHGWYNNTGTYWYTDVPVTICTSIINKALRGHEFRYVIRVQMPRLGTISFLRVDVTNTTSTALPPFVNQVSHLLGTWAREEITNGGIFYSLSLRRIMFSERAASGIVSRLCDALMEYKSYFGVDRNISKRTFNLIRSVDLSSVAASAFLFCERAIAEYGKPGSLTDPTANYWVDLLKQRAFVDACENMPRLSDNSIANLSEILEFLLSVIRREPPKLSLKPNELWLAYRYQYSTTKMDVQEAWGYVNRIYDIGSMFERVVAHGSYSHRISNCDIQCRVSLQAQPRANRWYNDLGALWRELSNLGLAPDLYYLWDSTPFSFIVDWFLPVGDVLGAFDASNLYTTEHYEFGPPVYSISYTRKISGLPFRCYSRWVENSSPMINPFYWMERSKGPSTRQVIYRSLDATSLIIGGLL